MNKEQKINATIRIFVDSGELRCCLERHSQLDKDEIDALIRMIRE